MLKVYQVVFTVVDGVETQGARSITKSHEELQLFAASSLDVVIAKAKESVTDERTLKSVAEVGPGIEVLS